MLLLLLLTVDDGFRCPDTRELIRLGDSTMLVRKKCREPDDRTVRQEARNRRVFYRGAWVQQSYSVEVEEWLYDFGSHDFMRHLRFENGTLADVRAGSYGGKRT